MTYAEIARELRRRERRVGALERKRARWARKIDALDAQIAAMGGKAGRRAGGGRARNKRTLVEALAATLKGKTLGVTEAAAAVQRRGYRTNSPNFRTIVNQALIANKVFRRVGRGKYTRR